MMTFTMQIYHWRIWTILRKIVNRKGDILRKKSVEASLEIHEHKYCNWARCGQSSQVFPENTQDDFNYYKKLEIPTSFDISFEFKCPRIKRNAPLERKR